MYFFVYLVATWYFAKIQAKWHTSFCESQQTSNKRWTFGRKYLGIIQIFSKLWALPKFCFEDIYIVKYYLSVSVVVLVVLMYVDFIFTDFKQQAKAQWLHTDISWIQTNKLFIVEPAQYYGVGGACSCLVYWKVSSL